MMNEASDRAEEGVVTSNPPGPFVIEDEDEENLQNQLPSVEELRMTAQQGSKNSVTSSSRSFVSESTDKGKDGATKELPIAPAVMKKEEPTADEENLHDQLPSVEEIRMNSQRSHGSKRSSSSSGFISRPVEIALITLVAILIVAVIGLSVGLAMRGKGGEPEATYSTRPAEPRVQQVIDFLVNEKVSSAKDLNTTGTPHNWAASWLADEDEMALPLPEEFKGRAGHQFVTRYIVALLYFGLNGPNWRHSLNFLSPKDTCDWSEIFVTQQNEQGRFFRVGVSCTQGFLSTLQLPGNNLEGTLPTELSLLTHLRLFAINSNRISGTLPEGMKHMSHMDYMALHVNKFSGSVPSWLGKLTRLRVLGLGDNNFDGTLPELMSEMTSLVTLGLDNNKLSGDLQVLQNLKRLKRMYLEDNDFSGPLNIYEDGFGKMDALEELDLSANRFTGTVPKYLLQLPLLKILDLHENELDGQLPTSIPSNPNLSYLALQDNLLSGNVPSALGFVHNLTHLDLSTNKFEGDIPATLGDLTKLKYLFLSNNKFTPGPIPPWIGTNLTNMKDLSLRATGRMGPIPQRLGALKELVLLDVDNNDLTGEIPRQVGELGKLRFLLLSRNKLSGQIPVSFEELTSLDMLMLNANDLTGTADGMCEKGVAPLVFAADCAKASEEIKCTCCTECCSDDDVDCNTVEELADLNPSWEESFERKFYQFGADMIYEG